MGFVLFCRTAPACFFCFEVIGFLRVRFSGQRGLRPLSSDRSGWQVAGGLMPLGIDLGTRHWHGFAEVGAGSEGFVRAGVAYHWGRP